MNYCEEKEKLIGHIYGLTYRFNCQQRDSGVFLFFNIAADVFYLTVCQMNNDNPGLTEPLSLTIDNLQLKIDEVMKMVKHD